MGYKNIQLFNHGRHHEPLLPGNPVTPTMREAYHRFRKQGELKQSTMDTKVSIEGRAITWQRKIHVEPQANKFKVFMNRPVTAVHQIHILPSCCHLSLVTFIKLAFDLVIF